ncbi:MAG TPA: LytTR family transcriptional regulator [Bacteroides sp.]|nr:LytTR family transcriptional regulator [Bacteroides sp.]
MRVLEYARKPYPFSLNRWVVIVSISLFISFFMVVFQPFGLQNLTPDRKSFLLAGYGLVTFIVLSVNMIILPRVFPRIFIEERWTVLREVFWLLWIVVTISIGNYIYSDVLTIVHWVGIKGLLIFVLFTFAIAIIPITGVTILSYNRLLKKNLKASQELNDSIEGNETSRVQDDNMLIITSENRSQKLETFASNMICIESEGNYVNVWFIEEGKIVSLMIRNTLKNIETQIEKTGILFKCHRAFIINLSYIEKVKGNSQGYRLQLKHIDKEIPVSRNYSKSFRNAFSNKA